MYEDYTGQDLIIATGAPGSRWSGTLRMITCNTDINISDETPDRIYDHIAVNPKTGAEQARGWHRGAYWGPDHEFGSKFDVINTLTKEEIVEEFKKPFGNWEPGKKIIKSHWFAYHLPFLKEMFPDAKFIGVQRSNTGCFEWWHVCGGWDISYPHYFWYKDDDRMREQIAKENACITQFFPDRKNHTIEEIFSALGLPNKIVKYKEFLGRDDKLAEVLDDKNSTKSDDYRPALDFVVGKVLTGIL